MVCSSNECVRSISFPEGSSVLRAQPARARTPRKIVARTLRFIEILRLWQPGQINHHNQFTTKNSSACRLAVGHRSISLRLAESVAQSHGNPLLFRAERISFVQSE